MTDAHTHIVRGEARSFICAPFGSGPRSGDVVFYGTHPWFLAGHRTAAVRAVLAADPHAGVGEIGLDRLRDRTISAEMRGVFAEQLELAAEFRRPVVLHGAKCWGEVMKACRPYAGAIPAFLFHGFSRSGGLIPEIVRLGGYISIGPALLNDHAVNYRELAKAVPEDRLLVESDATAETAEGLPPVDAVAAFLAGLRGRSVTELTSVLEANASRFVSALS